MRLPYPSRGDVWDARLGTGIGHEQEGDRPALVVSVDSFNRSLSGMVVVLPMTTTERPFPFYVPIGPPEGGLARDSFIQCDEIRAISRLRLRALRGRVSVGTLQAVEERLRILLDL